METLTRPKTGSRRKTHSDLTPKAIEPNTNGLDHEQFLIWVGKIKQENATFALARKRRDKVRKLAKNSGVEMGILDRVLKDADADPDVILKNMATDRQYRVWMDAPGKQYSLFEIPGGAMLSHDERVKRAERAGYTHGLMGENQDLQAYPTDNEYHQTYLEAYYKGQKILTDRIQPINMAIESEDKPAPKEDPPADEAKDEAA